MVVVQKVYLKLEAIEKISLSFHISLQVVTPCKCCKIIILKAKDTYVYIKQTCI